METDQTMLHTENRSLHPSSPQSVNQKDLVPLAFSTIGFAVLLGTAIMTACLLVNRVLVQDLPAVAAVRPDVNQPAATVLLAGALATLIAPMLTAWMLLSPVDVTYRRFGFSMVSGFGAIVVSLVSVPVNEFLGMAGLAGLLVLSLLLMLLLGRKVSRERAAVGA
jgi:hypothetical protein